MSFFRQRDPEKWPMGSCASSAEIILIRRLEKLRIAHLTSDTTYTTSKAIGVLILCCTWSLPEPTGIAAHILIPAMVRAIWIIGGLNNDTSAAIASASERIRGVLPTLLLLRQRVYGERSLEVADVLYDLMSTSVILEDDFATIKWGREASQLLLELRGEGFYVPPTEEAEIAESYTWDTADGRMIHCTSSHINCLHFLATAHSRCIGHSL